MFSNMDQIRSTMIQHEALFKEQVQALHKLYSIQKTAMQEIMRRNYSHAAQMFAFSSEKSIVLMEDQCNGGFCLEAKTLRPGYAADQAQNKEALALALSLSPFCSAFKEFKGCSSLCFDGIGIGNFVAAKSKPMRDFDLEKLPEDCVDESEIQVGSDKCEMIQAKSALTKRSTNTDEISVVAANLSVDTQSLNQKYAETELRRHPVQHSEINQSCDKAEESKVFTVGMKSNVECTGDSDGENNILSAVSDLDASQHASPSIMKHTKEANSLHQGSQVSTIGLKPMKFDVIPFDRMPKQRKEIILPSSTELLQGIESNDSITLTSPQSEEEHDTSVSGRKNLNLPAVISQTIINANSDCSHKKKSSYGSDNIQVQDAKICQDKVTVNEEYAFGLYDYYCEEVEAKLTRKEVIAQLECEQLPLFSQDVLKSSVSCTVPESKIKQIYHSNGSYCQTENTLVLEKPLDVMEGNDNRESMAAKILLSFAPGIPQVDSKMPIMEVDSSKSCADPSVADIEWNSYARRYATNCSTGDEINESLHWVKSVNRRRSSRRPR